MKKAKSIRELIEKALSKSNEAYEYTIGKLPPAQAKKIKQYTDLNLAGVPRVIDVYGILHALRHHGTSATEVKRGQVPVTLDDFSKVPFILKEPDSIEYAGKNSLNQDVFLFIKKMESVYVVAECVRVARAGNRLSFATMYKRKKPLPKQR